MQFLLHRLLPFVLFGGFACASVWYVRRAHRSWKQDGVLQLRSSRGPGLALHKPWAVYTWLGWGLVLGCVAAVMAVLSLVLGFR